MEKDDGDHPEKWPTVYERFCTWYLARFGVAFDPNEGLTKWDIWLAGWKAAGRHGPH